jgi:hypothetical protein
MSRGRAVPLITEVDRLYSRPPHVVRALLFLYFMGLLEDDEDFGCIVLKSADIWDRSGVFRPRSGFRAERCLEHGPIVPPGSA